MNKLKRLSALLAAILLMTVCPVMAEVFDPEAPQEAVSPYKIVLTVPSGWNSSGAVLKVTITDKDNLGWYRIEYRMNNGGWMDCEDLFDKGKAQIPLRENGTFTLRMTDPHGHTFEETAEINCMDVSSPIVSATVSGNTLEIEATDDLSGIAGVQVNSMLFTTVENGHLSVELDQNMNRFEKFAIRAFDCAGNFSQPISLDNPGFSETVNPTAEPTPTNTEKPTKAPGAATATPTASVDATETPTPEATVAVQSTVTPMPQRTPGGSLIYIPDDTPVTPTATVTAEPTAEPTAAPTPEPIIQTEYITIGPGMPYQADGNSHTLDVLYSAATNKQFITLQSKSGNTFYLVIDYDKPIDEAAEMYETYFLNLVDERDLLALMSDEEKEEVPTPTPEIIYVTPEPTAVPVPTPVPTAVPEKTEEPEKNQSTAILALIGILVLIGGGAYVLTKGKGGKQDADNHFEMDTDEGEGESSQE